MTEFGTAPHKLARAKDPRTSHEAARSIETSRLEEIVYLQILESGPTGIISDEVRRLLAHLELSYSSVTARYKALREKDLVVYTGEKRPGDSGRNQNIMVASVYAPEPEQEEVLQGQQSLFAPAREHESSHN